MSEFGDQGWRMREFGDQGAQNERVKTWRAERECRVQNGTTELHRTLVSAVNFGTGEVVPLFGSEASTQACHMHHRNQRDGSIGEHWGWEMCVKDKWVKQEPRT